MFAVFVTIYEIFSNQIKSQKSDLGMKAKVKKETNGTFVIRLQMLESILIISKKKLYLTGYKSLPIRLHTHTHLRTSPNNGHSYKKTTQRFFINNKTNVTKIIITIDSILKLYFRLYSKCYTAQCDNDSIIILIILQYYCL